MVCIQTSRDPTWFVNKTGFARGKGKGKGFCFFLSFLFEEKRGTALLIAFLRFAFLLSRPPSPSDGPRLSPDEAEVPSLQSDQIKRVI